MNKKYFVGIIIVLLGAVALLWMFPLIQSGAEKKSWCKVNSSQCEEWSVVVNKTEDAEPATVWLEAHGWPVRKRIDELHLLYVWLPKLEIETVKTEIRAQPWLQLLTDVKAVPN